MAGEVIGRENICNRRIEYRHNEGREFASVPLHQPVRIPICFSRQDAKIAKGRSFSYGIGLVNTHS